jgi:PAS domain S-box-containing protein
VSFLRSPGFDSPARDALSERPLWRLLEDAQDMVYRYRVSPTRGTEYVGGAVRDITGHTAAEFYADPDLATKAVHPEDIGLLSMTGDTPNVQSPVTLRWIHADGRVIFAEHRRVAVYDASGQLVAVEGIARDITAAIETQQQLRASQDQLRRLAASLQTAREEERASVARELHDELGQTLTALKLELGRTTDALKQHHVAPGVMDRLQSLVGLVEIGVAMVKRIATTLRPPALDHLGLAEAIRSEAATFRARTGVRCHIAAAREDTALPSRQQTALFRIFQEALTNVVRHAQASAVHVRLAETSRAFELRVADNGRGITDAEIAHRESIGLLGMRERAKQAGATLDIVGVPGKGTTISVRVPLVTRRASSRPPERRQLRRRKPGGRAR